MPQSIITRWGENLAVRVPDDVAKAAGLDDGQEVEVVAADDALVIRKRRPIPGLETLFAGQSPETWRELYADAYEWGPDHGRERLEE